MPQRRRGRQDTTSLPSPDSRFEAVVLIGDDELVDPEAAEVVRELTTAGAGFAVIGARPLHVLPRCLSPVDGADPLLLADSASGERAVVTRAGVTELAAIAPGRPAALGWVLDALWARGIGPASVILAGAVAGDQDGWPDPPGPVRSDAPWITVLRQQLEHRRAREVPPVRPEQGWGLVVDGGGLTERERTWESLLALADGVVGTSGAPLTPHRGVRRWAVASGLYTGNGPETHLLVAAVGTLHASGLGPGATVRRVLDLRSGLLGEQVRASQGEVLSARLASVARPGVIATRARVDGAGTAVVALEAPNGGRLTAEGTEGDAAWAVVGDQSSGIASALRTTVLPREGSGSRVVDWVVAYEAATGQGPHVDRAVSAANEACRTGFDRLAAEHRRAMADRWTSADIGIEGDDDLQLATRLALFHLMGSVPRSGEAAVGARGLTGQAYRGHVFWDADVFVLPFLAATCPESARAMLEYRVRRLPAAREAAAAEGRSGARFPWESAGRGHDVTPRSARDRTGRTVTINTGPQEVHVVADVAWAAHHYVEWTDDQEFRRGSGLQLLVETARYWASRADLASDGTAHVRNVIGPDEYHEDVDDNAFTNVMARWNLRRAADEVQELGFPSASAAEVARWRTVADALVDGYDVQSGVYEQFAGFQQLDPLIIAEVVPHRPIAADLFLGAERVHASQVLKQADVLMLHHLVPDEVADGSLPVNLDYYEPRTAHGSSLSPGVHAALFARADDLPRALQALRVASRIDLDDLTGSTSDGVHLAAMGGVWQALVFGFAGIRPTSQCLRLDPHLPDSWPALTVNLRYHGSKIRIEMRPDRLLVSADPAVAVEVAGRSHEAGPGGTYLVRRGPHDSWERV